MRPCGRSWSGTKGSLASNATTFVLMAPRLVLEIHEKHIRDERGCIVGMRSFLIDVTQRKRTEQALREGEKLYRHLVEHASDIIYRTDIHGRFRIFNSMAGKMLGYSVEELVGRSYLDLVRPDFRARVRQFYRAQLVQRRSHTYLEFPAITRAGGEIWFGQNVEIIEEDGRVVGFQAITRDITAKRRDEVGLQYVREELERRVTERTAELERANELLRREMAERQREENERITLEAQIQHAQRLESLGVLAGGIAHDFNNLLAVIMGHAGLALPEIPEGSRARLSIEEVISASRTAAQLTQQMLAYSGRGKFTIAPVNLSQLIEDVTRLIATLISKKATLQLNLDADLPAIEGDSAQLRQVLINLLTNASDALCERPGRIEVTTGTQEVDDGELVSVLPDRSCPQELTCSYRSRTPAAAWTRARCNESSIPSSQPSSRAGDSDSQRCKELFEGTMAHCRSKASPDAARHFACSSQPPDGRPLYASSADAVAENNWCPEGSVLVVDDEPAVRALACEILQRAGLAVMTAVDGYDAVSMFEAHSGDIDAVLLDLTMPGLDGGEVFQRLVQTKPDVKVILCSGYDVQDVNSMLAPHSPAGFLRKPYGPAELLQSFRSIW